MIRYDPAFLSEPGFDEVHIAGSSTCHTVEITDVQQGLAPGVPAARRLHAFKLASGKDSAARFLRIDRVIHELSKTAPLESFCTAKEIIDKMKRQPIEWEKILANDMTGKRLMSNTYKLKIKKQTTRFKNGQKEKLKWHFS